MAIELVTKSYLFATLFRILPHFQTEKLIVFFEQNEESHDAPFGLGKLILEASCRSR